MHYKKRKKKAIATREPEGSPGKDFDGAAAFQPTVGKIEDFFFFPFQ